MILQFTGPHILNIYEIIKDRFEESYDLPDIPLEKYLTYDEARLLYPTAQFEEDLTKSKKIYAFEFRNRMFVHPTPIITAVKKYHQRKIKSLVSKPEQLLHLH